MKSRASKSRTPRPSYRLAALALIGAVAWGTAQAAPPAGQGNGNGNGNGNGRWDQVFDGPGRSSEHRCLAMYRGPGCITAASRKEAAQRLKAAREAANLSKNHAAGGGQ